jgi:hypothetical protein
MTGRRAAVQCAGSDLVLRCKAALTDRLRALHPTAVWLDGFRGYLARVDDNLFAEITPDLYRNDYASGAGGELQWWVRDGKEFPPKMQAAYSSSALVVNCFAPWKYNLGELELCGRRGFSSLWFERKVPTGLRGTSPHLDLFLESLSPGIIAIESKATEYLQTHETIFPPSYESAVWPKCVGGYSALMRELRSHDCSFQYLDAAQLVKHALGLASTIGDRDTALLYLFWEPENRDDFREFDQHCNELRQFAASVAGSSIRFLWMSYSRLLCEWAKKDMSWSRQHASRLRDRYAVRI